MVVYLTTEPGRPTDNAANVRGESRSWTQQELPPLTALTYAPGPLLAHTPTHLGQIPAWPLGSRGQVTG